MRSWLCCLTPAAAHEEDAPAPEQLEAVEAVCGAKLAAVAALQNGQPLHEPPMQSAISKSAAPVDLEQVGVEVVPCGASSPFLLKDKSFQRAVSLSSPEGKAFLAAASASHKGVDGLFDSTGTCSNVANWVLLTCNTDVPLTCNTDAPESGSLPVLPMGVHMIASQSSVPDTCNKQMAALGELRAYASFTTGICRPAFATAAVRPQTARIINNRSFKKPSQPAVQGSAFGDMVTTMVKLQGQLNASETALYPLERSTSLRVGSALNPRSGLQRAPSLAPPSPSLSGSLQLQQTLQTLQTSVNLLASRPCSMTGRITPPSSAILRWSNAFALNQAPESNAGSGMVSACKASRRTQQ